MDLSLYKTTDLENWIYELYQNNGIYSPADLDIDHIASAFGVDIVYYEGQPFSCNESFVIFLDKHDEAKRRKVFFHELCHVLRHCGDQRRMNKPFRDMQEMQAGWFQKYASMPFYMIAQLELPPMKNDAIQMLADAFRVPSSFAKQRLEQIQQRVLNGEYWEEVSAERARNLQLVHDYWNMIAK